MGVEQTLRFMKKKYCNHVGSENEHLHVRCSECQFIWGMDTAYPDRSVAVIEGEDDFDDDGEPYEGAGVEPVEPGQTTYHTPTI